MPARFRPSYSICSARGSCYRTPKPYPISSTMFSSASPRISPQDATTRLASSNGDLNNISAVRPVGEISVDTAFVRQSLAIQESDDEPEIRQQYRPFLLHQNTMDSDWIANLEISTAMRMAYEEMHRVNGSRLKVLVLYGSLRERCVMFRKLCNISWSDKSPALIQGFYLLKQLVFFSGLDVTCVSTTQLAYLSRMICNTPIPRSRSFVA